MDRKTAERLTQSALAIVRAAAKDLEAVKVALRSINGVEAVEIVARHGGTPEKPSWVNFELTLQAEYKEVRISDSMIGRLPVAFKTTPGKRFKSTIEKVLKSYGFYNIAHDPLKRKTEPKLPPAMWDGPRLKYYDRDWWGVSGSIRWED